MTRALRDAGVEFIPENGGGPGSGYGRSSCGNLHARLILRSWRPSDLPVYTALNADPEVRRFWPSTLTREQSDEQAEGF